MNHAVNILIIILISYNVKSCDLLTWCLVSHELSKFLLSTFLSKLYYSGREGLVLWINLHCIESNGKTHILHAIPVNTRHLRCVVSPPIMIKKCTHGEHRNYDLTIIILWNDHYDLNFNVGMSDDSKK